MTASLIYATVANAREPWSDDSNAAKIVAGWWAPQRAGSPTVSPQLMINLEELTHFEASESLRTSQAQPTRYRVAEPNDGSITRSQYFGSTLDAGVVTSSPLEDPVSLSSTSFLSLLQTRYTAWESNLEESRTRTDVNGVSVYSLLLIDDGGWRLPITLYISPLRGSDAW
jgi:hypothetical protein